MLETSTTDSVSPSMSDAKRALLEKYLRGGGLELFPEPGIAPRPRDEPALTSFGQEQL